MRALATGTIVVRLSYPSPGALRFDCETQLPAGGLLVDHTIAPPLPDYPEGTVVVVELCVGDDLVAHGPAELIDLGSSNLQLGLDQEACAAIEIALTERFGEVSSDGNVAPTATIFERTDADAEAAPDQAAVAHEAPSPATPPPIPSAARGDKESADDIDRRIKLMSLGEKIQCAMHGNVKERTLLARDKVPTVQAALVRNPKLTVDELMALARSPHLGGEAAEAIAHHPTWGSSPQAAMALCRNPRTPTPIALKLLAIVTPGDLRILAKGGMVREQLAAAARKRLLGT